MAELASKLEALNERIPSWRRLTAFEGARLLQDIAELSRVWVGGPERAQLHMSAGIVRMKLGQPAEALDELQAGRLLDPEEPIIALNAGVAALRIGRSANAMALLLESTDLLGAGAWSYTPVLANLAVTLHVLGRCEEATAMLDAAERAADLADKEAQWSVACASASLGEHVRAVTFLDAFLALEHGRTDADQTILGVFERLGGWDELDERYDVEPELHVSTAFVQSLRDAMEATPTPAHSAEAAAERAEVMDAFAPLRVRATESRLA